MSIRNFSLMPLKINPVLDVAYLNQVYGDDASIIHLIFDAFLGDSVPRWVSLQNSIDTRDLAQAASIVHGLKPSFTMAGVAWLRPKIEDLEKAIKAEVDTAVLQQYYSEISDELNIVMPILAFESERLAKI